MQGDIVVERGVDRPGTEPVGERENEEHRERAGDREAEQPDDRQTNARERDEVGTDAADQPIGKQAREDRAARDEHRHDAERGDGHAELLPYDRPSRAEERVGEPEGNKAEIDHGKQ